MPADRAASYPCPKRSRKTVDPALLQLVRHKTWANVRLLEHCHRLDDEALDATMPGTYGTIRDTLRHLVASDENYLSQLNGERGPETHSRRQAALSELAEHLRSLAPRWEPIADGDHLNRVVAPDGVSFPASILIAQAVHHADDHRTHTVSILGAHGLEVPRLDVWA